MALPKVVKFLDTHKDQGNIDVGPLDPSGCDAELWPEVGILGMIGYFGRSGAEMLGALCRFGFTRHAKKQIPLGPWWRRSVPWLRDLLGDTHCR